jgi:ankyrin repeat protein
MEKNLRLILRKFRLVIVLGLLTAILSVPWLIVWRQDRLDQDLIAAIRRTDTQAAIALLNRGADANARVESHGTVPTWRLLWNRLRGQPAAADASTPLILLLDGSEKADARGRPVYLPENVPLATALLDHGAKINARNAVGWNPLNLAILSGKNQTVHLLLARGADVRPVRIGKTGILSVPLIWACSAGHCSTAEITDLLDHGAGINDQDSTGETPIFAAVMRFRPDVVRLLLARHADLTPKDIHGRTVLMWVQHFRTAPQLREIAPLLKVAPTSAGH